VGDEKQKGSPFARRYCLHVAYIYVGWKNITIVRIDSRRSPIFSSGIPVGSKGRPFVVASCCGFAESRLGC
jgi:hypothetical protein